MIVDEENCKILSPLRTQRALRKTSNPIGDEETQRRNIEGRKV
jgi:hypothetical protein